MSKGKLILHVSNEMFCTIRLALKNSLSFSDTFPVELVCMESQYGFNIIGTQRVRQLGKETGGYGGVIYSLKSNTNIMTLSDLKDKRIGVSHIFASASFAMPWQVPYFRPDTTSL